MSATMRRLAPMGAAALLSVVALAGCSSSSDDTQAATPGASPTVVASVPLQVCTDAAATKAALASLVSLNVLKDGTDALRANFAAFKTSADTLVTEAQSQFAPQTTAVKSSIADLQSAVDALKTDPSVAEVAGLAAPLLTLKVSTQALLDQVQTAC